MSTDSPGKAVPFRQDVRDIYSTRDLVAFNACSGLFTSAYRDAGKETQSAFYVRFAEYKSETSAAGRSRLDLISTCQHALPCLVPYVVLGQTPSHFYMVMERREEDCPILEAVASGKFEATEASVCSAFTGVFYTLAKMHEKKLVHGQISPAKIILRQGSCFLFDLSTGLESTVDLLTENCSYLAPEVLDGQPPGPESDVWALGATLYHIFTGHTIYPTAAPAEYVRLALSHEPFFGDPVWNAVSPACRNVVQQMLQKGKSVRASMKQVAECDWVNTKPVGTPTAGELNPEGRAALSLDIEQRKCLTRALGLLASEKTRKGLNDIKQDLVSLDYMKKNVVELRFMMGKALTEGHAFLGEIQGSEQLVYYAYTLDNAVALNRLLLRERHSALFYRLSRGKKQASEAELKILMGKCGRSAVVPDAQRFGEIIHENQRERREELNLDCEEFLGLLDSWDFNLPEELIYQYIE